MKLTPENKKILLKEYDFAIRKMKESQRPEEKLFYFSRTYDVASTVFNIKFEPQLVFLHFVLINAFKSIMGRITSGDPVIKFPEGYFDKLTKLTEDLYDKLKKDEEIYQILEKFALLTFLTAGNGYYLNQRDEIKI